MARATNSRKKHVKKKQPRIDKKLKTYAAKRHLRKGSAQYNAYVHGTVSRRMAAKYKRTHH